MRKTIYFLSILLSISACNSKTETKQEAPKEEQEKAIVQKPENQELSVDQQIKSALLAAPLEARDSAKVYGYDDNGELITLREGSNNFICIADNPKKNGFEVVSYHSSLEPYMSSGRELRRMGKGRQEMDSIRETKALAGIVKMPEQPATLHIYYGKEGFYNTETGQIENSKYRYVVYMPYATQESTGLSLKPNKSSHPWLMFPGKYNAHIMITPAD